MSRPRKSKSNPPVRTKPPKKGEFMKSISRHMKRIRKQPGR